MSDTPISDSTPHNVADLGMLCRRLERELNAANAIIRQQQLLDEENLRLKDRIKRLEEAGNQMELVLISFQIFSDFRKSDSIRASLNWHKAKEAKP
jgi:hypothetical protein